MSTILDKIFNGGAGGRTNLAEGQNVDESGNGAAVGDFSVAGAIVARLNISSIVGSPDVEVSIQHSDDGESEWGTLVEFTEATGELVETVQAPSPRAYLRAAWSFSGDGSCRVDLDVAPVGLAASLPSAISGSANLGSQSLGIAKQLFRLNPIALSGSYQGSATSIPVVVEEAGTVASLLSADVSDLPASSDAVDLGYTLLISNLDGTQVFRVSGSAVIAAGVSGGSIDFSAASHDALVGSDLSWDPDTGVTSAAGGVFVVQLALNAGYD